MVIVQLTLDISWKNSWANPGLEFKKIRTFLQLYSNLSVVVSCRWQSTERGKTLWLLLYFVHWPPYLQIFDEDGQKHHWMISTLSESSLAHHLVSQILDYLHLRKNDHYVHFSFSLSLIREPKLIFNDFQES